MINTFVSLEDFHALSAGTTFKRKLRIYDLVMRLLAKSMLGLAQSHRIGTRSRYAKTAIHRSTIWGMNAHSGSLPGLTRSPWLLSYTRYLAIMNWDAR